MMQSFRVSSHYNISFVLVIVLAALPWGEECLAFTSVGSIKVNFVQQNNFSATKKLQSFRSTAQQILFSSAGKGFGAPKPPSKNDQNPLLGAEAAAALSPERKANLFQSLLRDLQIEGVPLLECDANSVETYQAAVWTVMSEMSDSDEASKTCMVLEGIPISALLSFADDFATLKLQPRMMAYLPELERFTVEVVGKGVGAALVFEAAERTPDNIAEVDGRRSNSEPFVAEERTTAAMKCFVDRMVIVKGACPYTKNIDFAPSGLEAKGVNPATVGYRYGGSSDAVHAVASFWSCICELQSLPESELSTIVLSLPCIGPGNTVEAHERFATVVELISRVLCLFRGDAMFGLVHFHPAYDRDGIFPNDKPAYGHLPPKSWLRPMLRMNGNVEEAQNMSDAQLSLSDYQRRSPHTAINILRMSQVTAAAGAKSIVDLPLDDGRLVKASGITTYSRNAIQLAETGRETLDGGVAHEMQITWSA